MNVKVIYRWQCVKDESIIHASRKYYELITLILSIRTFSIRE
jgi:hypothetical protein